MPELSPEAWRARVNVSALDDEARRRLLDRVKGKFGFTEACRALGLAKSSMHRYLASERRVPDEVARKALEHLDEAEFREAVGPLNRLASLGVVRPYGTLDYSTALEILALAMRDEYLRQAMIRLVVENFKEDVRRALGLTMASVKFEWTGDFESFLAHRKRRRKVSTEGTLSYYRALFERELEGKVLSEELVEAMARHSNPWVRVVFRHYIQYLLYRRRVSPELYGWLMEAVPSRSYRLDVRPYKVGVEEVAEALRYLEGRHKAYYTAYRLVLESGCRLEHALRLLREWSPAEEVELPGTGIVTPRLVVLPTHARYYLGLRGAEKPCEWVYMSLETLKLLESIVPVELTRHQVYRYAKRHGFVAPKMLRKLAWMFMRPSMGAEAARFAQSRLGELRVDEARYEDLLSEADEAYPRYLAKLEELGLRG